MDLEFHQLELRYESLRSREPEREKRLLASLSERGQQVPIVVVAVDEGARYVVIDGYKRVRAQRRLRRGTGLAPRRGRGTASTRPCGARAPVRANSWRPAWSFGARTAPAATTASATA